MTHSAGQPLPSSPGVDDEPVDTPRGDVVEPRESDVRDRFEPAADDVEPRGSRLNTDEDPGTPVAEAPETPDARADEPEVARRDEQLASDRDETADVTDRLDEPAATDGVEPAASASADEPARAPSDGNLAPGAPTDDPMAPAWDAGGVEQYRGRWRELQLRFVDDPYAATGEAAALVDDAVSALTQRLTAQKASLDGWQTAGRDDTEVLRMAMQRYRVFLDRLLAS
jgi:hypothetical protein